MHRLSRKITEREPFHMDDLGALKVGGKIRQFLSSTEEGELIELAEKLSDIGLCLLYSVL